MKFFIKTYGCQMNERDSEAAAAMLIEQGFTLTDHEEKADILIFNTCSVREQAEVKAIGKIGIMKRLKKRRPHMIIGIMGCMAQRKGEELLDELPHVDFVVGTDQLHRVPDIIQSEIDNRHKEVITGEDYSVLTSLKPHYKANEKVSAFMAIMRGCNRFCSYCIVPYVRGREKSRTVDDIVAEAEMLTGQGVKELFLLGQNVSAFGLDGKAPPIDDSNSPFGELLRRLNEIESVKRIRFTSPHPAYFNDSLIDAIVELPKVCDSIHLPLQSGSDAVLKTMNRPYTAEKYLDIINKLKAGLPDITFSTDIIVGFPGETQEDFLETRRVMNEVGFDNAYIFKYSPRRGTKAAGMDDDVEKEVKEERNQILLNDLRGITEERNQKYIGRELEVLVEGVSKRNEKRFSGRTTNNKVVIFEPARGVQRGDLVTLEITGATSSSLFAGGIEC